MFGSFGCCDNFRDCHHRERDCDHREKEKEVVRPQRPAVCNLLANISVGTEITSLIVRDIADPFAAVVFEGFANGVALFSTGEGLLRVCPTDIVAIVI
ncbi:DUF3915 family protein [Bacillus cereus group sp. MYBK79-1]|uniref:DUF3915 family protein n=1 Tax=unclassified Bacillus cereus group TaxID=2750818 RepID=UPI003F7A3373